MLIMLFLLGETMTLTGQESQGCASRSVSHTSYQSQLAGLRSRALRLKDYFSQPSFMSPSAVNESENSGAVEISLQQQNVESYGEEDLQNNKTHICNTTSDYFSWEPREINTGKILKISCVRSFCAI